MMASSGNSVTKDEEMDCLGHFNMELFYFSEIIHSFSLNAPQIDKTTVQYLTKILHSVSTLLYSDRIEKIYDSDAQILPEDFQQVVLYRFLVCEECTEEIPFLWQLFREHKCTWKTSNDTDVGMKTKFSRDLEKDKKKPMIAITKPKQNVIKSLDDSNELIIEQNDHKMVEMKQDTKIETQMIIPKHSPSLPALHKINLLKKGGKEAKNLLYDAMETIKNTKSTGEELKNSENIKIVVEKLEYLLQEDFPKVKIYPFGSYLIGLAANTSSLNLFVDVGDYYKKPIIDNEEITNIIKKIENLLKISDSPCNVRPHLKDQMPILKAYDRTSGICFDLSFDSGLPVVGTKLISYFFELQPDAYDVACFVTTWYFSISQGFHKCKTSTYLISLLVIFYMQTINLLPSIWSIQKKKKSPIMIGDWRCDFKKLTLPQLWIAKSNNPLKILIGFFEFYYHFDYQKFVMCPFLGRPVERSLFDYPDLLPHEMIYYKNYVQKLSLTTKNSMKLLKMDTEMCVQDPFELCSNVNRGIKHYYFDHFLQHCGKSAEKLRHFNKKLN